MEEKILEILKKYIYRSGNINWSIPAKEITTLYSEFIEWCIEVPFEDNREESDYIYLVYDLKTYDHIGFESIDELFDYWYKNIKNK